MQIKQNIYGVIEKISLLLVPAVLIICTVFDFQYKAFIIFFAAVLSFLPYLLSYEKKRPSGAEIMLVVILAACAAVGRLLFAGLPNFKPVTAIIIIAGITLGGSYGFVCGALAALASNIFFGQGAWTVWQMYAWGLIGYLSGMLYSRGIIKKRLSVCIWGFLASVLYGIILDSWSIVGFVNSSDIKDIFAVYIAGIPFTAVHAASTVIFLLILYKQWLRIINRIKNKYV